MTEFIQEDIYDIAYKLSQYIINKKIEHLNYLIDSLKTNDDVKQLTNSDFLVGILENKLLEFKKFISTIERFKKKTNEKDVMNHLFRIMKESKFYEEKEINLPNAHWKTKEEYNKWKLENYNDESLGEYLNTLFIL